MLFDLLAKEIDVQKFSVGLSDLLQPSLNLKYIILSVSYHFMNK